MHDEIGILRPAVPAQVTGDDPSRQQPGKSSARTAAAQPCVCLVHAARIAIGVPHHAGGRRTSINKTAALCQPGGIAPENPAQGDADTKDRQCSAKAPQWGMSPIGGHFTRPAQRSAYSRQPLTECVWNGCRRLSATICVISTSQKEQRKPYGPQCAVFRLFQVEPILH